MTALEHFTLEMSYAARRCGVSESVVDSAENNVFWLSANFEATAFQS